MRWWWLTAAAAAMAATVATAAPVADADPDAAPDGAEALWVQWLERTHVDKEARTPAQHKVASTLHALDALATPRWADDPVARRVRRHVAARAAAPAPDNANRLAPLRRRAERTRDGAEEVVDVMVDVDVTAVDADVRAALADVGAHVVYASEAHRTVRARLPLGALEPLAAHPEVRAIRAGLPPQLRKVDTSEGVTSHGVPPVWERPRNATGAGVKVGVLSDSASPERLVALQRTGDLHRVYAVAGQESSGSDEGAAMMEIVFDMAPEADIVFATGADSSAAMADNIRRLADAGCEVIVDDIGWPDESPLHDASDIIAAIVDVTGGGAERVVYVSSAGNANSLGTGHPTVWAGPFAFADATSEAHLFPGVNSARLPIRGRHAPQAVMLWWSDGLTTSANDYDLHLLNSAGQVVARSEERQAGADAPQELIVVPGSLDFDRYDYYVQIVNRHRQAAPRYLHLMLWGCEQDQCYFDAGTAGSTYGHPAARGTIGVAAIQARGNNQTFADAATLTPEPFSSDGPVRLFYGADGDTPLTPGNLLTGGELRQAPVLSGADGVSTATPGFRPFYGTSAAAPHVAALVALIKSAVPPDAFLTNANLVALLKATARRVGTVDATGWNSVAGWGVPMVAPIIDALQACPAGSYVDVDTLACTPCPNGRAIPAGSAGADACTDPRTAPGATPPPPPPPVALTEYPYPPPPAEDDGLSGGAIFGIFLAVVAGLGLLVLAGMALHRRRQARAKTYTTAIGGAPSVAYTQAIGEE